MRARRLLRGGSAAVLAVTLAACSVAAPAATTAPTVLPTPQPTPSPTPVDAAPAFVARLADPAFSATVTVAGDMKVGSLTVPISGSMELAGGDVHSVVTFTMGTTDQTTETLEVGTRSWVREHEVWFAQDASPSSGGSGSLGSALLALTAFQDRGVERRDGREVHRLELPAGAADLPLSAFGITDPSVTEGSAEVVAYALDDGTPVALAFDFAWTQASGNATIDAVMSFEMAFEDVGEPVDVEAPEVTWAWHESDVFGYRIAHPADWDVEPGVADGTDYITGFDGNYLAMGSYPADGSRLTDYTSWIGKHVDEWYDGTNGAFLASTAAMLGDTGARQLEIRVTWPEGTFWLLDVVTVRDDVWYTISYVTDHEPTTADRELFATMLETFAFR